MAQWDGCEDWDYVAHRDRRMSEFMEELRDKRLVHDLVQLRKQAFSLAVELIEASPESEGMSPAEIEIAASELCLRQMKELVS